MRRPGRELLGFARSASLLGSAAVLAQGVGFVATPILTRIYAPDAFGFLGVLVAVSGILAIVMTLRLDVAIVAAAKTVDARRLFLTAVVMSGAWAIVAMAVVAVGRDERWLFVPAVALTVALQHVVTHWLARTQRHGRLATLTVGRSVAQSGGQVGLGLAGFGSVGLALGVVVGGLVFSFQAIKEARKAWADHRASGGFGDLVRVTRLLRKFSTFPTYSLPQGLMSEASQATALLFISSVYGLDAAGLYAAALRLSQLPVSVASRSIQQTLYGMRASNASYSEIEGTRFARRLSGLIALVSLPVFVAVGFWASPLITWLLGDQWAQSASLLRWLLPWLYVQLIAAPAIALYRMHGDERAHFLQTIGLFSSRLGAVALAVVVGLDLLPAVAVLSFVGAGWNLVMIRNAYAGGARAG